MSTAQSTQRPNEATLHPSLALALDLTLRAGGINRFEANLNDGHCSLGQRISDLRAKGYKFAKTRERWTDPTGKPHYNVVRYAYLGWECPQAKQSNGEGA